MDGGCSLDDMRPRSWLDAFPWLKGATGAEVPAWWDETIDDSDDATHRRHLAEVSELAMQRLNRWTIGQIFPGLAPDVDLFALDLPTRAVHALKRRKYARAGDLSNDTLDSMMDWRGVGGGTVDAILQALANASTSMATPTFITQTAEPSLPSAQPFEVARPRPRDPQIVDKARRLMQFLAASQRLRQAPVRTFDSYERDGAVLWLGRVPDHPAATTGLSELTLQEPDTPFLTVRHVDPIPAPQPPADLEPWLDGPIPAAPTDRPPALRTSRTVATESGHEERQLADADGVQSAYKDWIGAWTEWAQQEQHNAPVRQLYRSLFEVYGTLTGQPEVYELVLGLGCLAWGPADHPAVRRHILTAPATVEFDDKSGTLTVRPGEALDPFALQLDLLDPSRAPTAQRYQDLVSAARTLDAYPLDRDAVGGLLRSVINTLDPDGRYDDSDVAPAPDPSPVLAFAPALLLRRRSQASLLQVFQTIDADIAETQSVPAGLMPLIDPNFVPPAEPDPTPGAMVSMGDEIFLPLPLNEAQLDIVQRVDRQAQTLVQGPPGTGKTHLAAALISHLLAQGKRVLVTAQTDRALKEVRGKLPQEIRPLAVAVLGTDLSDMSDLKVAVEGISNRSNEADPETLDRRAADDEQASLQAVGDFRAQRAGLRSKLVEARSGEVTERSFLGYTGTLAAIARAYQEQKGALGWLSEFATPGLRDDAPLTDAEAVEWLSLLQHRDAADDEAECTGDKPDLSQLPTPEQFAELLAAQASADAHFGTFGQSTAHPAFRRVHALPLEDRATLQHETTHIGRMIADFEKRQDTWIRLALGDIRSGRGSTWASRATLMDEHLGHARGFLQQLNPATRVVIAEGADLGVIASLARNLRDAVAAGRQVPRNADGSVKIGAFAPRVVKDSRPLFDAVRVDGLAPTTAEELTQLLAHLESERFLDVLDRAWPAEVAVPEENTLHERFQWHATEAQLLHALLKVGEALQALRSRLIQFAVPQPDWTDLHSIGALARMVDAAGARDDLDAAESDLATASRAATAVAQLPRSAATFKALADATSRRDLDAYRAAHQRLVHLCDVHDRVSTRESLTARVAVQAPALTSAVTAAPDEPAWHDRLASLGAAWDRARTGAWILAQESTDSNDLEAQLDLVEDRLRHEVEKLAAGRAWRHALSPQRITGEARADLNQYVRLVKALGKGTGRYAEARRGEIRRAMDNCRPSVPVWIMPLYRIAEQLRVSQNMFDVVVVDEASQAGLEATFLQYLAPKIVVIGDDKQVSPAAVGVEQQSLRDLAAQYLYDYKYKDSWHDPKMSLFDAAAIWYGQKRTLVEHRRCVPEIIGFSNRIAYEPENIRLIPVRQFGAQRLEPVKVVHVREGFESGGSAKTNKPEAEALVDQLVKCLESPDYEGKTFGVISLTGPTQARLINNLLLDRVSPEDWAARDLRCGDAAAFQGSERDVMFLSMVSAPEPGQRMGARVDQGSVQRYNVAASRAKDQMWVFHSVALSQLTNPEDMRFKLLDYCYNTVPSLRLTEDGRLAGLVSETELVMPFDSLFEQRVHNRLVERGYTVIPQYEVMGYRIDLVVVGAKTRLAVECDGDHWHGPDQYLADLARERDLRRCGWDFFRLVESSFYVDPHASLEPLWAALNEHGIELRPTHDESERAASASEELADEVPSAEPDNDGVPGVADGSVGVQPPDVCEPDDDAWDANSVTERAPRARRALVEQVPFVADTVETQAEEKEQVAADARADQPKSTIPTSLRPRPLQNWSGPTTEPPAPEPSAREVRPQPESAAGWSPLPYRQFSGWAPAVRDASTKEIDLALLDIIGVEGPVTGVRAQAAFVAASGGRRLGHVIADQLDASLARLRRRAEVISFDEHRGKGIRFSTFRLPSQPAAVVRELGPRALDEVPKRELATLLYQASRTIGWEPEPLFREALRLLERHRVTAPAITTLMAALPLAHSLEEEGQVTTSPTPPVLYELANDPRRDASETGDPRG